MPRPVNVRRDRILFFIGIVLLLLGGLGFLVATFAHDLLRIPLIGEAYDGFGWINITFLALGVACTVIGTGLTVLGLRGGVLSNAEIEDLEAGGSES